MRSNARPLPADLRRDIAEALKRATGGVWKVTTSEAEGAPPLRETRKAAEAVARDAILATPVVRAAMAAFPGAELESWPTPTPEQRSMT